MVVWRPSGDVICAFLDLRYLTALKAADTISLRARSILWSFSRRLAALARRLEAFLESLGDQIDRTGRPQRVV